MPRLALAKIPVNVLQNELARRAKKAGKKLAKLLRQRAKLDDQIAELEALAGGTPIAAPKAKPGPKTGKKRGRKPGPKPAAAPKAPHKRGTFRKTGAEFIMDLLKKGGARTAEINTKWSAAGRGGTANVLLVKLSKVGKLKREPIKDGRGSTYTLA